MKYQINYLLIIVNNNKNPLELESLMGPFLNEILVPVH